jgi:hypothetical protein
MNLGCRLRVAATAPRLGLGRGAAPPREWCWSRQHGGLQSTKARSAHYHRASGMPEPVFLANPKPEPIFVGKSSNAEATHRAQQAADKPAHRRGALEPTHRRMRAATSATALFSIVQATPVGEMSAAVLTAAFHRLAILQVEKRRLARSGERSHCNPPAADSLCQEEGCFNGEGLRVLERAVEARLHEFEASHCALTLWSIAKLSSLTKSVGNTLGQWHKPYEAPPAMLDALMLRARDTAGSARPRNVANIMWACATLGLQPPPDLVDALSRRITSSAESFGSQAVSNILWALASLRLQPSPELAQALLQRATAVLPDSSAQGVANTAWALGSLSLHPPAPLLHALHARTVATSAQLTSQGVATCLWGHAALGLVPSPAAFASLQKACIATKGRMSPHELALSLWSLASLAKLAAEAPLAAGRIRLPDGAGCDMQTQHVAVGCSCL